jgi:hypothetical protein
MGEVLSAWHHAVLDADHSAGTATVDDHGRAHAPPVPCAPVERVGPSWRWGGREHG